MIHIKDKRVKSYTDNMTLEEQIGQLLVVGFYSTSVPQTLRALTDRALPRRRHHLIFAQYSG